MNDKQLAFYFDESVQVAIAKQLKRHGIDAVTARDLAKLGDFDPNHLQRATSQNRVLVTYDDDYIKLARPGAEHAGIVFVPNRYRKIGIVVKELRKFHVIHRMPEIRNLVWFLSDTSFN